MTPTPIKFIYGQAIGTLALLVRNNPKCTYPGGSRKTNKDAFEKYIKGKRLIVKGGDGERVQATMEFNTCRVASTQNAKAAEQRLLDNCDSTQCPFNVRERSGLTQVPGLVYVLTRE